MQPDLVHSDPVNADWWDTWRSLSPTTKVLVAAGCALTVTTVALFALTHFSGGSVKQKSATREESAEDKYAKACRLYSAGRTNPDKYVQARCFLEAASKAGHVKAKNLLAAMLIKGQGGEKDFDRAHTLLKQAAKEGDAEALNNLGMLYGRGSGVEKDEASAREYFKQAAEKGNVPGMVNYGIFLKNGKGGDSNLSEARRWFASAKDQGHNKGTYLLAVMMVEGQGGAAGEEERDKAEGKRLLQGLAEQSYGPAITCLKNLKEASESGSS